MEDRTLYMEIMERVIELRRTLHSYPELAGQEIETARRISEFFAPLQPDVTIEHLGGSGLAFVFGKAHGPTLLLRCEMDALPIEEQLKLPYRSTRAGVSHKCGHDGHMAILAAVGVTLSEHRPSSGRVVLLYQPAEENGAGAAAVLRDSRFDAIKPDFAFALHNVPGFPLGQIIIRPGAFACASRGMSVTLHGQTAHAAQPDTGVSPALAVCQIIHGLADFPEYIVPIDETAFATVVGATLGEKAFGTAPGNAEVWATLRSETNETMTGLIDFAQQLVRETAERHRLEHSIEYEDVFDATVNSQRAVDLILEVAGDLSIHVPESPFRWSEDFGRFTGMSDGALFGIGAGNIPNLHNPDYDFPDELIPFAVELFRRIVDRCGM
jgi:amidohydrolase